MKARPTRRISSRAMIALCHDVFMAGASVFIAFYLRLGDAMYDALPRSEMAKGAVLFATLAALMFARSGLYRGIWRYASMRDLGAITQGVTLTIVVFVVLLFLWTRLEAVPRSVPVINWFVLMALLGGPRFLYRMFKDRRLERAVEATNSDRIPVLLVGASDEAELFIRAMSQTKTPDYRAVGILAERPGRIGREIHGVPVLGAVEDFEDVIQTLSERDHQPRRLILTRTHMDGAIVRDLLDRADRHGMTLARLPRLTEFKSGLEDTLEIHPVAVEDLLGRPQTPLDREAMAALVTGKRVLITGAGGSIGGELVRQVSRLSPAHLTLVELSEFALYSIDREMMETAPGLPRTPLLADVRDAARMRTLFAEHTPDLVFHAAALKHVPLVEANLLEGCATNVLGTVNVAEAAKANGVATMVMISTDKAVNPTSIMGATKRCAEVCCQTFDLSGRQRTGAGHETRFITVRFGNVLGSTGSVVPLFQRQLAEGGPLTVTHPDMTRYFMTIREAVELVLQASALGQDAIADGRIFVLDMGEPVKIVDLARQMIRLAGYVPDKDVSIEFTGIRPGEKLFEEIFHGDEPPVPTDRAGILLAAPRIIDMASLTSALEQLQTACRTSDPDLAVEVLRELVPEYIGGFGDSPKERALEHG